MAEYSYETYEDLRKSNQSSNQKSNKQRSKVGYFKLDAGKDAIVRFDYETSKDFNLVTVHNVKVGNAYRKVSCLRDSGKEPLEKCPLCAKGEKVSTRFFAKLIHYTKDETGRIIATPEIANFPKKMADKLVKFIQEYGDLRENLIKIVRTGSGLETEYEPVLANPAIYKEELGYVKDFKDLDELDLTHHSYMIKSKEDIEEYLKTGEFPYHKQEQKAVESQSNPTTNPTTNPVLDLPDDGSMDDLLTNSPSKSNIWESSKQVVQEQPQQAPIVNTQSTASVTSDSITSRPRRTYEFNK